MSRKGALLSQLAHNAVIVSLAHDESLSPIVLQKIAEACDGDEALWLDVAIRGHCIIDAAGKPLSSLKSRILGSYIPIIRTSKSCKA